MQVRAAVPRPAEAPHALCRCSRSCSSAREALRCPGPDVFRACRSLRPPSAPATALQHSEALLLQENDGHAARRCLGRVAALLPPPRRRLLSQCPDP